MKHLQNVFSHRQLRFRISDDQVLVFVVVAVCMVAVNGDQRHFGDQTQSLAEDVRNGNVIRLFVVGIQGQHTALQSIHHVFAGCLHDNVADKSVRQLAVDT